MVQKFETTNTGINVTGDGVFSGNVSAVDATFTGNVSIAGTLTYEDAKNVDSVGLITARSGIRVTGGVIEAQAGENKIPSLYAAMGNLPSAGSHHGMFAHVHGTTGRGYFAHAGNWLELVNREINGVVGTGTETYNIGNLVSTSSTATSLNVTGVGTFASSIQVADSIIHQGDTNTLISFDTNRINLDTGGINRVSIADTGVVINDELYINGNQGLPLRIEGSLGTTENIHIRNYTSGGHIQIGFRQNDSDGHHHRAYITASKGTGSVSGKLQILVRGQGGGTNRGFILDAGVGIQLQQILPETDSSYDLGSNSKKWANVYADTFHGNANIGIITSTSIDLNGDLDVDGHTNLDNVSIAGVSTFTGLIDAD